METKERERMINAIMESDKNRGITSTLSHFAYYCDNDIKKLYKQLTN